MDVFIDMRCKYASKPCFNVRSIKTNGQLHTLCDYHRSRANSTQRRWHQRQCQDKSAAEALGAIASPASTSDSEPSSPCQEPPRRTMRKAPRDAATSGKSVKIRSSTSARKRVIQRGRVTFRGSTVLAVATPPSPLPLEYCGEATKWETSLDDFGMSSIWPPAHSGIEALECGQLPPDTIGQFLEELCMESDMAVLPSLLVHSIDASVA